MIRPTLRRRAGRERAVLTLPLIVGLILALTCATAARAGSLVYVQGGNVFLADEDGGHPYQVTLDGSTSTPDQTAYRSPTEAADGTIVAGKGGELVRMKQNGTVLNRFVPDTGGYPLAAALSPDGTRIAYNFSVITACTVYVYSCGYQPQPGAAVTSATGRGAGPGGVQQNEQDGQWIDNATLVLQNRSSYVDYDVVGQAAGHWFVPMDAFNPFVTSFPYPVQPVVSHAGTLLAVVMRPNASGGNPSADDVLEIWKLNGAPPAAPTPLCDLRTTDPSGFQSPTFLPGDTGVAWTDSAGVEATHLDYGACTGKAEFDFSNGGAAAVPGASQASFGLAANDPGPRTSTSTTPPPTGTTTLPAGTTPTAPAAPSAKTLATSVLAPKSITRGMLGSRGLTVRLTCPAACAYTITLAAPGGVARTLELARTARAAVTLGAVRGSAGATTKPASVKLTAKAKKALARLKHGKRVVLTLTVQTRPTSGAGASSKHLAHVTVIG